MPWGSALTGETSLGSSLGSRQSSGRGGWGASLYGPDAAHASGGGEPGWLGSFTDPLGIRSTLTNIGGGVAKTVGGAFVGFGQGIGHAAAGEWDDAGKSFGEGVQHSGDFIAGLPLAVEDFVNTAALPLGGTHGLTSVLKTIEQPINKAIGGGYSIAGEPLGNPLLTQEMSDALMGPENKGMRPGDFFTNASHIGLGGAWIQLGAESAMIAGPIAGLASSAAADATASASADVLATAAAEEAATAAAGTAGESAAVAAAQTAGEVASKSAARLQRLGRMNDVLQAMKQPNRFIGRQAAELFGEMRKQAFPPLTEDVRPVQTVEEVPFEEVQRVREQMHPDAAGAEAMASTDAQAGYALDPDLASALDTLVKSEEAKPATEIGPVPEGHVRLFNGGTGDRTMWTDNKARAESYAGEGGLRHIDVPEAEAEAMRAGDAAREAGHQPTEGDYYLTPGELDRFAQTEHPAAEPEVEPATRPLAKSEPKVEPRKYDTSKGQVLTEEEKAVRDTQLRSETAAAREHVNPPLYVFDELGKRLNTPTPAWAERLAEMFPPSVNRSIGRLGASFVDQVRYRSLYRNAQQAMEVAQQVARSSPAMRAGEEAARTVLDRHMDRGTASARIGEEIHARLNGESIVTEWARNHPSVIDPAVAARIERAGRGDYVGITDDILERLSPDERTHLEESLQRATDGFKVESAKAMETLLATRYGAKGLEQAVLGPDQVPMTPEQIRLYKRAERDERTARKARERIPSEREKRVAVAARAEAAGLRKWGVVDRLRAQLGYTLSTAEELYRGIPKGMKNDAAQVIAAITDALASEGGALADIGTGEMLHPTEGIHVALHTQFDIPLESWATDGATALHDAIFNPKGPGGTVYDDPAALYGGLDAKLAVNIAHGADGSAHVVGTLTQHTINGAPMQPWQAYVLGSAWEQFTGLNFSNGRTMGFATDPTEQALMMHYHGDVLDTKSGLTRWASQRQKTIRENNLHITDDELHAEMSANLWLDHIMEGRSNAWKHGDVFNTELGYGKGEPSLGYLAQTIMEDLSVNDHTERAMVHADVEGVNNMLAWYYKSHDFIEQYRGQTVPLTGRDASETFYDLLALSSVMASPTQNLGRALAGLANLDDLIQAREAVFKDASSLMDEIMANKPNDVVYVRNLGVEPDSIVRNEGETVARWRSRQVREGERVVGRNEGGTPVARRWLESPALRDLSNQTSMTTGPKYRIIDALLGRLNLETATAEDIGAQPEWWTGKATEFSDANLSTAAVLHHADLLGVNGPELEAYKAWAVKHEDVVAAREVRDDPNYVAPITDAENVEAKASPNAGELGDNRLVSAQEYQTLAMDGRAYVEQALANSSPHALEGDILSALKAELFRRTREPWGGATVDAHTGNLIPDDYVGDTYAVTARLKGMKPITVKPGGSVTVFDNAIDRALKQYKAVLDSEGGHLGVFYNDKTSLIEIDPVYNTKTPHETEAVGAYTHAVGGAYHFRSGNGYWIPHVDEAWGSKQAAGKAVRNSEAVGHTLSRSGAMRPAYENALMEYHGSGLLAKLRSFRDNLAHPHSSLAVTLDSIMAQLFGFDKTHWGVKGEYAKYADMIRENAARWSQVAGRPVMPHEVQALLWVYAKRFIGTQDWGRLQTHLTNVHKVLDTLEEASRNGKRIVVKNFDPLGPWWKEELQFSRDQLAVRTERKPLRTKRTAGTLTPEEAARLEYLEQVPTRQETLVNVQTKDGPVESQVRNETSYDAKVLAHKEDQYVEYLTKVATPMRKAVEAGDYNLARSIIDEYVTARRKAIMGSVEGAEFGPEMLRDPKSVGAQSLARLQYAKHVPAPNFEGVSVPELYSKFGQRVRGVTLENPNKLGRILMRLYSTADISTLLHEDLHAFRLHAPGDEVAELSRTYPHVQDETLTPARVADEERFVSDFMGYLRARRSQPGQWVGTGPLSNLFNAVADTMADHYGPALNTDTGAAVPNSIVDYWDNIFNADIQRPAAMADPLHEQYAPQGNGVNTRQLRGESDEAFAQRTRQYGEARGKSGVLQQRIRDAEQRAVVADKFANEMKGMLLEPTRHEIIAERLEDRASRTLAKIEEETGQPTGSLVPRAWRSFHAAIDRIAEEIKDDPSLAPLADEIPQNFRAMLKFAREEFDFEPTYMPELTWDMAQKYLYRHLTLGTKGESPMRKQNLGVLNKMNLVDRSLESLGASTVMAMQELLRSRLIQFIEEHEAYDVPVGSPLPDARVWHPWDGDRDAIVTGRTVEGKTLATTATKVIPRSVHEALHAMERDPVDLPFRFIWKGGPMQVWKHLILTFSPTWYIRNFIGNIAFGVAEGVRWADFKVAYKQWKSDTMPGVARGRSIYKAIDEELGTKGSVIRRNRITDLPDVMRSEGIRRMVEEVLEKLRDADKVVDSITRAAVYAKHLRTGGSPEFAVYRAFEATGDFGRLGPIERSLVVQVIPFYAFQKAMFRLLARFPDDHPMVTATFLRLGQMHEAYMKEKLGGAVPDYFKGADFMGGKLTNLNNIVPFTDAYRMMSAEGIASSANPFIKIFVQQAFHQPGYGSMAGMDERGNLVPTPDIGSQILETYKNPIPGLGTKDLGRDMFSITSGMSQAQYDKLVKRIRKTLDAQATLRKGGYLATDAYEPKKPDAAKKRSGWGSVLTG